jgi:hypothetical protein
VREAHTKIIINALKLGQVLELRLRLDVIALNVIAIHKLFGETAVNAIFYILLNVEVFKGGSNVVVKHFCIDIAIDLNNVMCRIYFLTGFLYS